MSYMKKQCLPVDTLKWITPTREHKYSALQLQVNGKIKIIILIAFCANEIPISFYGLCTYKQRLVKKRGLMTSTESEVDTVFNRSHESTTAALYNVNSPGRNLFTEQHICSLQLALIYSCIHVFIRTWRLALPFSPYNDERTHFHSGMEIIMDPMKTEAHTQVCFCVLGDGEQEVMGARKSGQPNLTLLNLLSEMLPRKYP